MIPSVSSLLPAPPTPAPKPWAPGDPSSFQQLFNPLSQAPTPAAPPAPAAPPTPFTFEQDAAVTGYGTSTSMNPEELATAGTANTLAKMLGGQVTTEPAYGGGFSTSAPTRDITFTDSKVTLNAGVTAYLFNTYGDAPGSQAWQQIDKLLGRDPMSTVISTT
jgi:hypothetical protein